MGTYKVLQDIEAEDKLLGPLSLRQFIYAVIVVVSLFIGFKFVTANLWYMALPLLPIILFFGMLAAPFGHDQSNEVWLLAKIGFWIKPRKRLWDQSGIKELVTITVPKVIEKRLTKDFTKDEARSRLQALADTLDSRGWAVKNVDINDYRPPINLNNSNYDDRLVNSDELPQDVPDIDNRGLDLLDRYSNSTSYHVDQLIEESEKDRKEQLRKIVNSPAPSHILETTNNTAGTAQQTSTTDWFTDYTKTQNSTNGTNNSDDAPKELVKTPVADTPLMDSYHDQTLDTSKNPAPTNPTSSGATDKNTDIINLSANDDLDVATIARQADKVVKRSDDNTEVVISLR